MKIARKHSAEGFTLIEFIVAVGLFAMASAILIQSVSDALTAYETVKSNSNREQLFRFAVRTIISIEDREEMEDGGDLEMPEGLNATWEVETEEADMVALYRATITIDLQDNSVTGTSEERSFELYLYRPEWHSDEAENILEDRRDNLEDLRSGF